MVSKRPPERSGGRFRVLDAGWARRLDPDLLVNAVVTLSIKAAESAFGHSPLTVRVRTILVVALKARRTMWNQIEVEVGPRVHRGRYRIEGRKVLLEWRGGRVAEWCGSLRPDVVATQKLKQLAASPMALA
jgi:hypothetical protein